MNKYILRSFNNDRIKLLIPSDYEDLDGLPDLAFHGGKASRSDAHTVETGAEVVDFNTVEFDTDGAITTGGSWVYRAQTAGKYLVTVHVGINFDAAEAAARGSLAIRVGGTVKAQIDFGFSRFSDPHASVQVTSVLDLTAGQNVDVLLTNDSATTFALVTDATKNIITVTKLSH